MGTPIRAPDHNGGGLAVRVFPGIRNQRQGRNKIDDQQQCRDSCGAAMLLASGMKISAEPNSENPRAVPDTKAITQIAMAALMLTVEGMRPMRLMR